MKTYFTIPKHYRKLESNEIIRKGDIFRLISTGIGEPAMGAVGLKVSTYQGLASVWRRKHVALIQKKVVKKVHPVEKNPLVKFRYPKSESSWELPYRTVRLISANEKYLVGIEISDKNKFKKFLRKKASSFEFLEFNKESMS